MSTRIAFYETKPATPLVGDAWYSDPPDDERFIAVKHRGKRQITVALPGGWFGIYSIPHNGDDWDVSGEPHNLTLSPSVQFSGWHGYIRNGELVDA